MEQIMESITNGLSTVLIVTGGVLFGYLITLVQKTKKYVDAETAKVKDAQAREVINDIVDKLDNLIVEAIHCTEQNIVKEIKEASADGKLTLEEGKEVLETTALNVYGTLSNKTVESLKEVYGNVLELIENKTQKIFDELKKKGEI